MALTIWTKCNNARTFTCMSPVLRHYPSLKVHVRQDYSIPPDTTAVLALGNESVDYLAQQGILPKGRKVTSLRGLPRQMGELPVMVSYNPDVGDINHGWYVDMLTDVGMVVRRVTTGSFEPKLGHYRWVPDFSDTIAAIKAKALVSPDGMVDVSYDLETRGKDPFAVREGDVPGAFINVIQFTHTVGQADCVRIRSVEEEKAALGGVIGEQLKWLLTCPFIRLKGANLKFDLVWSYVRSEGAINCTNFTFDTSLVGSLLDENRSNALDVHTKIYAPELGGYCVAPETLIWREDLTWVSAEDVQVGDVLVGFDESPKPGERRKLQESTVLSKQELQLRCYKLTFSDGRTVSVSDNHAWLIHPGAKGGNLLWKQTERLRLGTRMKVVTEVVHKRDDFQGGWVSGFLDGEGHVHSPKNAYRLELGWAQKPGIVWAKAESLISKVASFFVWNGKSSGVLQAKAATYNALKIMQAFRPMRLLSKKKWVGAAIPQEPEHVTLVAKELLGVRRVVSLKTTTSTFVAEGLASHNSDHFDAAVDKNRMDLVPDEKMLPYAGGDTDADLRIADRMKAELLQDPGLTRLYVNIVHPASRAFEVIERGGVYVDLDAYKELEYAVDAEMDAKLIEAKKILGGRLVAKHYDPSKRGGLNLKKPSLIEEFMFSPMGLNLKPKMMTAKSGKPSTSADHLLMFAEEPEAQAFVGIFQEYGKAEKVKSTYIGDGETKGFLQFLRSDGRFHPTYFLFVGDKEEEDEGGTVTGRLSAKDPAFQTIPKHSKWAKLIRRCFIAPAGYVVVERDYSQGELRVVACIANCLNMIKVYRQGKDLHTSTAASVVGLTYEQLAAMEQTDLAYYEATRQKGKAGNFGLVFGMQVDGFMEYARKNYRVIMSKPDATAFRDGFFMEYHELLTYHEEYKKHARNHQFVRSPLGRIRHLPLIKSPIRELASKAERQAINAPVQSTLTDMQIWALALEHKQGLSLESPPFGSIHDAIYNYMPEDRVDVLLPRHLEVMEHLPFELVGWNPQLEFKADAKYGKNMADLTKFKMKKPPVSGEGDAGFVPPPNVVGNLGAGMSQMS